jgi:ribosomal protein L11 methyltransferase
MTMTTVHDSAPTDRQWLKITFACPLPLLESAADLLGVLSGVGVEQSPETDAGALLSGFFQLDPATGAPHDREESTDDILALVEERMTELFALYGCVPEKPAVSLLADQDWATSWQQYFKPFEIVPGLVIKPTWEAYQPESGQHVIEMDPGMAFGTGQHASTRMALALISKSLEAIRPKRALDVGTGTGILAMGATLLGAERVIAIDNDPDAIVVARENIEKNDLAGKIEASTTPTERLQGVFQLVSANIVHDVLVEMAVILAKLTAPGGHLILAGILSGEQEENIVEVYRSLGLHPNDRLYQEEWVALQFIKGKI